MAKIRVIYKNGREAEIDSRLAAFMVDKNRASYVEEKVEAKSYGTKQLIADEKPKKRGRPKKKNSYETKELVSE